MFLMNTRATDSIRSCCVKSVLILVPQTIHGELEVRRGSYVQVLSLLPSLFWLQDYDFDSLIILQVRFIFQRPSFGIRIKPTYLGCASDKPSKIEWLGNIIPRFVYHFPQIVIGPQLSFQSCILKLDIILQAIPYLLGWIIIKRTYSLIYRLSCPPFKHLDKSGIVCKYIVQHNADPRVCY